MSSLWSNTIKHLPSHILHICCFKTSILDIYEKLFSIPWHDLWGHVKGYFGIDIISKICFSSQRVIFLVGSACLVNFAERPLSMWTIDDHQINSFMLDLFSYKPIIHSLSLFLNISIIKLPLFFNPHLRTLLFLLLFFWESGGERERKTHRLVASHRHPYQGQRLEVLAHINYWCFTERKGVG